MTPLPERGRPALGGAAVSELGRVVQEQNPPPANPAATAARRRAVYRVILLQVHGKPAAGAAVRGRGYAHLEPHRARVAVQDIVAVKNAPALLRASGAGGTLPAV